MARPKYVGRVYGTTTKGGTYNGTGFILNAGGDVATCWHVVESAREIFVKLPFMKEWEYNILHQLERDDVAVLRPIVPPPEDAPHARLHPNWFEASQIGAGVEVFGYSNDPNTDFVHKKDSSISNTYPGFSLLVLDRELPGGDSGGPVLNQTGHVIGIVTLTSSARRQSMVTPISRLCQLLTQKCIPFAGPEGSGDLAEQAIDSLPGLMGNRKVRSAVQRYGEVFEKSSQHVSTLHAYKKAHELLYGLELGCYNKLIDDARQFPHDKVACDRIFAHLVLLAEYVSDAEDILTDDVKGDKHITTMRNRLKDAYAKLAAAHREQDITHCDHAIELLGLLVSKTQSDFNMLLNRLAKALDIESLVVALQAIQEAISNTKLPPATAKEFQLGVDDLDALGRELQALTTEHDDWQQLDDALRMVNHKSQEKVLDHLDIHWTIIASGIEGVCSFASARSGASADVMVDWLTLIKQASTGVDEARNSGNSEEASLHFKNLRGYAAERFDRMDKKLLRTCGRISKVKDPLRTLLNHL